MDVTHENVTKWLDEYFEFCNSSQGTVDDVADLARYFADDFEFWMFTPPPFFTPPLSRSEFLMLFVHPGLYEAIRPQHYVIDTKAMMVVVKFEFEFVDETSGRTWPPLFASAHYQLAPGGEKELQIKRIDYWTQTTSDDRSDLFEVWIARRQNALEESAALRWEAPPSA